MANCEALHSMLDVFVDGELPADRMVALQNHVEVCEPCTELVAFHQAMRQSLQRVVEDDAVVGDALETRIRDAIAYEERAEARRPAASPWWQVGRLSPLTTLPLAAAAALLLWLQGPWSNRARPTVEASAPVASAAMTTLGSEELLDRLIDYHSAPPAPQVTEPQLIPELSRDVGVRVALPSLVKFGARWQGASVVRVRPDQRAAYFRYRTADNHSVTVYVYNASRMPLHAGLQPRIYREEPVYVGHRRGYSIAASLRHGVGYAVATDLEEEQNEELVHVVSGGRPAEGWSTIGPGRVGGGTPGGSTVQRQ